MATFIDISRTLSPDSVVFPGDDSLRFVPFSRLDGDSHFAKFGIEGFSGHVMSHVDVPAHVIEGGKTLDDYTVEDFVFEAVLHAVEGDVIDRATVEQLTDVTDVTDKAVLFKTSGSDIGDTEPFTTDYAYVTEDGAVALVEAGVKAVGIDYLSIDSPTDHIAHQTLMSRGILIFEALQFVEVQPGEYTLFAFPLKIKGGDGSCVRAVLRCQ
jgi:arylformamidase